MELIMQTKRFRFPPHPEGQRKEKLITDAAGGLAMKKEKTEDNPFSGEDRRILSPVFPMHRYGSGKKRKA